MSTPPSKSYIRPKNTGAGSGFTTAPSICPPPFEVTVTTQDEHDKVNEYWRVTRNESGNYNIETTRSKLGPYKYKLFNKDNVLSATLFGEAQDFALKFGNDARYTIAIPGQNLFLTYEARTYPPLTFKPEDGSDVQRFEFIPIAEGVPVTADL